MAICELWSSLFVGIAALRLHVKNYEAHHTECVIKGLRVHSNDGSVSVHRCITSNDSSLPIGILMHHDQMQFPTWSMYFYTSSNSFNEKALPNRAHLHLLLLYPWIAGYSQQVE